MTSVADVQATTVTPITAETLAVQREHLSRIALSVRVDDLDATLDAVAAINELEVRVGPLLNAIAAGNSQLAHLELVRLMDGRMGRVAA